MSMWLVECMIVAVLVVAHAQAGAGVARSAPIDARTAGLVPLRHRGIVFGAGEWSWPGAGYNTTDSAAALQELAWTGATHVRVLVTWYTPSINSTTVTPLKTAGSPLATPSDADVMAVLAQAKALGLSVLLAPILDPDWDLPAVNTRAAGSPHYVWRGQIGSHFTEADWAAWFKSYTAFVQHYAAIAETAGVDVFEVGSELDVAFETREADWRTLVAAVRDTFKGELTAAVGPVDSVAWWDALDYIGNDAYYSLSAARNASVAELTLAWEPIVAKLAALSAKFNKPVLFTEVGYQSRPGCYHTPAATKRPDGKDCSCWKECFDLTCQSHAYEALLRSLAPHDWWAGVYWWLWRSDPTEGGSSDSSFTPRGKPAEMVLRRWYGNVTGRASASRRSISDALGRRTVDFQQAGARSGPGPAAAQQPFRARGAASQYQNGWVFGSGEWTYPGYRLDSEEARESLRALAATGANSVEFVVMWYFDTINSTELYPIDDYGAPLRTASDEELTSAIDYAKSLGLHVLFSPMIDPNFDLPLNCRQCPRGWRGAVGTYWPNDCSDSSKWGQWWAGYGPYVLRYAALSEAWGVDDFLVAHELYTEIKQCPSRWAALIADVRKVFSGQVSVVAAPQNNDYLQSPWISDLDFIGVDCYNALKVPHPDLPWQNSDVASIAKMWDPYMAGLANMSSHFGGKDIVCTEMGFQSRPWVYSGINSVGDQLDPSDCSVYDQCISLEAQTLAYQALFQTFYAQSYFRGFYLWMWRADPTHGGTSDDDFTLNGKPAVSVLHQFWHDYE